MTPLVGFAPDMEPTTPGILTDCANLIPFEAGMRGAPTAVSVGLSALAAECRGIASVAKLDGTRRVLAGTASNIYEVSSSSWTSRASGFTLGSDDRWVFAQFGDSSLAATPSSAIQRSTSTSFSAIAGAPSAKLLEVAQGFAVALNTSSYSDEWYCSAYLDETNWTLSVANQCVKGRLAGGTGPINASKRFGDDIVAFKSDSIHVGRYVGAPEVWRWHQVGADIGCVGQDAVVDTAIGLVFVGRDNVYAFDGTAPRPLATGVIRDWLMADMAGLYQFKTKLLWDRAFNRVWIFYAKAGGDGTVNRCVVYHVLTKQWGIAHQTIEAVINYTTPAFTYDGGSPSVSTYDGGPAVSFDSLYWVSGAVTPAIVNGSHVVCTLSGITTSSSFTTGDYGDDQNYRLCRNLRIRFGQAPTSSTVTGYVKDSSGITAASVSSSTLSDGRHNLRQTARWHRFKVDTTGDLEVSGIRPEFQEMGQR